MSSVIIQTLIIEIFDALEEGKNIMGEADPRYLRWKWSCPETQQEWILRMADFKRMDRSNPFDQVLFKAYHTHGYNFSHQMLEDQEIREEMRELKKWINFI